MAKHPEFTDTELEYLLVALDFQLAHDDDSNPPPKQAGEDAYEKAYEALQTRAISRRHPALTLERALGEALGALRGLDDGSPATAQVIHDVERALGVGEDDD